MLPCSLVACAPPHLNPRSVSLLSVEPDAAGSDSVLTFNVSATELCDDDDTNVDSCCDSDLSAILIGFDGSKIKSVTTVPDLRPNYTPLDVGVNITGVFGQGANFQIKVVVEGSQTVESLALGQPQEGTGFRYRLYGSADLCEPGACCATSFTGTA